MEGENFLPGRNECMQHAEDVATRDLAAAGGDLGHVSVAKAALFKQRGQRAEAPDVAPAIEDLAAVGGDLDHESVAEAALFEGRGQHAGALDAAPAIKDLAAASRNLDYKGVPGAAPAWYLQGARSRMGMAMEMERGADGAEMMRPEAAAAGGSGGGYGIPVESNKAHLVRLESSMTLLADPG